MFTGVYDFTNQILRHTEMPQRVPRANYVYQLCVTSFHINSFSARLFLPLSEINNEMREITAKQ